MHCVAHFAEETCAERPANGDLETPSQDLEKGKTKTPFYEQTFLWRTEKSSFCFTLFQNSRFCPKKFTFLTYIFIHESNYDFLVRKTTEKYLLGWLTFYRLGCVEFFIIYGKKLNFYYSVSFLSDKAVFSCLEDTKITSFKKSFLEYKREDIFCVTSPRYARAKMYLTSSWGIITISQIRAPWVKKIYE